MDDTLLRQMMADAKLCNKRLRQIIGNHPSPAGAAVIKSAASKGGSKKKCPPCNNNCNQGRDCPARRKSYE